jgi:hypothetical protein
VGDILLNPDGKYTQVVEPALSAGDLPRSIPYAPGQPLKAASQEPVIRATLRHPFYVKDRGWVAAADLKPGDLLRTADDRYVPVIETFRNGDVEPVFNFCVEDWHTYFAGGVLVHNASGEQDTATLLKQAHDAGWTVTGGDLNDLRGGYQVDKGSKTITVDTARNNWGVREGRSPEEKGAALGKALKSLNLPSAPATMNAPDRTSTYSTEMQKVDPKWNNNVADFKENAKALVKTELEFVATAPFAAAPSAAASGATKLGRSVGSGVDAYEEARTAQAGRAATAGEAKATAGATSNVGRTSGSNSLGPFTDFEVSSAGGALEARLQGNVLNVDWVEGNGMVFKLKQVQDSAGGAGAFKVIKGYATDKMAQNITKPGYLDRLAQAVSARLGGTWTAKLEQEGEKTFVVLTQSGS